MISWLLSKHSHTTSGITGGLKYLKGTKRLKTVSARRRQSHFPPEVQETLYNLRSSKKDKNAKTPAFFFMSCWTLCWTWFSIVSTSHPLVQFGEIPDQVRDDNFFFLATYCENSILPKASNIARPPAWPGDYPITFKECKHSATSNLSPSN